MGSVIMNLILSGILLASPYDGMSHEKKGESIVLQYEDNWDNYGDSSVFGEIIIESGSDDKIIRGYITRTLFIPNDGEATLTLYQSPADLKGLAILTKAHKTSFDDIWIYIPDFRRVKRVSSQTKGSEFMGTNFQTEDLIRPEPEKYQYKWLADKPCGKHECHLVDRYPKETSSIYSRQVLWIDRDHFQMRKIESFDKQGKHVKTLEYNGYRKYKDKFWRPSGFLMLDRVNGFKSSGVLKDWKFGTGLDKSLFTVNGLKNIR